MTLVIVGATESAWRHIRTLAPAGVRVVDPGSATADWVLVATAQQRVQAIATYRLPPYRIVEVPGLASGLDEPPARDALRAGLEAMAGIGPARVVPSPVGVAMARMFVRRLIEPEPVDTLAPPPADAIPIGAAVAGAAARIPAGPRLDEILTTRALERVKRFVSHAVRLD